MAEIGVANTESSFDNAILGRLLDIFPQAGEFGRKTGALRTTWRTTALFGHSCNHRPIKDREATWREVVMRFTRPDPNFGEATLARKIRSGICQADRSTVHGKAQMPLGGIVASGYGRFGRMGAISGVTGLRPITVARQPGHFPIR